MPFARLAKYGARANSYDALKAVALLAMMTDHLGHFIWPDIVWLRLIGRFAFPLFFFAIGYSLHYRSSALLWGYAVLILAAQAALAFPPLPLNILFSVALSRLMMQLLLRKEAFLAEHPFQILCLCLLYHLGVAFLTDYGAFGLLYLLCGYYTRKCLPRRNLYAFLGLTTLLHGILQATSYEFTLLQTCLLALGLALMAYGMAHFTIRPFHSPKQWASLGMRLLARYSLELYAIHYIALMLISAQLFPLQHAQFHWYEIPKERPSE